MLTIEPFELMPKMSKNSNDPSPAPENPYLGIYIVGYVDDAGERMNVRDAIRIANVMLYYDRLKKGSNWHPLHLSWTVSSGDGDWRGLERDFARSW